MELRPATLADIPALLELWKEFMDFHIDSDGFYRRAPDGHECWGRYVTERLENDDFLLTMAFIDGTAVGYCLATVMEYPPVFSLRKFGFIQDIAVTASARRQGVAAALFEQARVWLLERGISRLELKVDSRNETSQGFWKKMGFLPHTETWTRPAGGQR